MCFAHTFSILWLVFFTFLMVKSRKFWWNLIYIFFFFWSLALSDILFDVISDIWKSDLLIGNITVLFLVF